MSETKTYIGPSPRTCVDCGAPEDTGAPTASRDCGCVTYVCKSHLMCHEHHGSGVGTHYTNCDGCSCAHCRGVYRRDSGCVEAASTCPACGVKGHYSPSGSLCPVEVRGSDGKRVMVAQPEPKLLDPDPTSYQPVHHDDTAAPALWDAESDTYAPAGEKLMNDLRVAVSPIIAPLMADFADAAHMETISISAVQHVLTEEWNRRQDHP